MLPYQPGRHPAKGGGNDALAEPECHRNTNDPDAVHDLLAWQGAIVLRRHHGDFMTASDEGPCQPLGVDGQPGGMRAVIGQNG